MKNFLTFAQLDYLCQHQAKAEGQIRIEDRQAYININLMKIYDALEAKADPWYRMEIPLIVANNISDISQLYVKNILNIFDGTPPWTRDYHNIEDSKQFQDLANDIAFQTEICFYWHADLIKFFVGSQAPPMLRPYMEFRYKPGVYTEASKDWTIDIPPESNGQLTDLVVAAFVNHVSSQKQVTQ